MAVEYQCTCSDGRTVSGSSRWELSELKQMDASELADVISELAEFAKYFEANFYHRSRTFKAEIQRLEDTCSKAKNKCILCGVATVFFTVLWIVLAVMPSARFSGLTLTMALLTFLSFLIFIPVIFRFISVQESSQKRLPKIQSKLERLRRQQEQEIYGTYLDYLIAGHIVSPEYSMSSDALELIVNAFRTGKATKMSQATALCKKKYPRSPVPRIITSLCASDGTKPVMPAKPEISPQKTPNLNKMQSQEPDLRSVLQLAEYLHAAVKSLAANQKTVAATSGGNTLSLTLEEETLLREYRELAPDEQKRIRRVVHSFFTKQY